MRASTQHLINAVSLLTTSVTAAANTIRSEMSSLSSMIKDGADDEAIEAQAAKVSDLTSHLDAAVKETNAALGTIPPDSPPVASGSATGAVDPASLPADTATDTTGRDPASGAPAGQGAVGAANT